MQAYIYFTHILRIIKKQACSTKCVYFIITLIHFVFLVFTFEKPFQALPCQLRVGFIAILRDKERKIVIYLAL